jgi:hypothetical protein
MSGRNPRKIARQVDYVYDNGFGAVGIVPITTRFHDMGYRTYHAGERA